MQLEAGDQDRVQRLIQYFLRCPFSQAWLIEVTCLRRGFGRQAEAGKVIYKTEHNPVGQFPEPGDQELLAGPSPTPGGPRYIHVPKLSPDGSAGAGPAGSPAHATLPHAYHG